MNDEQKGKSKTSSSKDGKNNDGKTTSSLLNRLPPGLTLGEIRCAQRHKDSHLYAYLVTTRQGSSGPCLVFCNSIAAVRRVGETLKTLGLPVKMLHAQMQQVSFSFCTFSGVDAKTMWIETACDQILGGNDEEKRPERASGLLYDTKLVQSYIYSTRTKCLMGYLLPVG